MDRPPSQAGAVEFTEEMNGFLTLGESDYHEGFRRVPEAGSAARAHLTVTIEDVDRFVADPAWEADVAGLVECSGFGGKRPVERGVFNVFVDRAEPGRTHAYYRLFFFDAGGDPLTLSGFRDVRDDGDRWPETSTLYARVFGGHTERDGEPGADVVAAGILTTRLDDFARQLATFRTDGPSPVARARVLDDLGGLLLGRLWKVYGAQARTAAGLGPPPFGTEGDDG